MDSVRLPAIIAASVNTSIVEPASPATTEIRSLFVLVLIVSAVLLVVVWSVLVYSIIRFRRRKHSDDSMEPPQLYGSNPIEIAWTAAPALIVFLLVLVITRTELKVRAPLPTPQVGDNALFVTVIGRQWWWEYVYDYYDGDKIDLITANELHVPASSDEVSRPVYLTLQSADVTHSFWVPRLAGKTDLIPGRRTTMSFQTNQPGLYLGQCAEYCGTQHANMLLRVYVDSPEKFDEWLANERKPAADDPQQHGGRGAFLAQSCVNCHRIRGTRAAGTFGPDLTHLMSRQTLASGIVPNQREELLRWIKNPHDVKPGCLMPAFGLDERDVNRIVDYLHSLR